MKKIGFGQYLSNFDYDEHKAMKIQLLALLELTPTLSDSY